MLDSVIVMHESAAGIVRRVNVDALDLSCELLFEGFESEQIVAEDQPVIKDIVVADTMLGVIRFGWVF